MLLPVEKATITEQTNLVFWHYLNGANLTTDWCLMLSVGWRPRSLIGTQHVLYQFVRWAQQGDVGQWKWLNPRTFYSVLSLFAIRWGGLRPVGEQSEEWQALSCPRICRSAKWRSQSCLAKQMTLIAQSLPTQELTFFPTSLEVLRLETVSPPSAYSLYSF